MEVSLATSTPSHARDISVVYVCYDTLWAVGRAWQRPSTVIQKWGVT